MAVTFPKHEFSALGAAIVSALTRPPPSSNPQYAGAASNGSRPAVTPFPETFVDIFSNELTTYLLLFFWVTSLLFVQLFSFYIATGASVSFSLRTPFPSPPKSDNVGLEGRLRFAPALFGVLVSVLALPILFLRFHFAYKGSPPPNGWRTDLFYSYFGFIFFCFALAVAGYPAIEILFDNWEPRTCATCSPFTPFVQALFLLAASLWRPLGGARVTFSAIARRLERFFEASHAQMREDGAELASYVTQVDTLNWDARCHWVKRKQDAAFFAVEDDDVDRRFWALGHLMAREEGGAFIEPSDRRQLPSDVLYLKVSYVEDSDSWWRARFVGTEIQFRRRPKSSAASDFFAGNDAGAGGAWPSFDSWRDANFFPEKVVHEDPGGAFVIVSVPATYAPKNSKEIMDASNSNLRAFTPSWKSGSERYFRPDLLEISPRDVKGEADKTAIFNMSEELHSEGTIDFFISHSWGEEKLAARTQKYEALKSFLHSSAPAGASLWFDKTCLNTLNPEANANAIAALPIFTGTCKRIIVLLSPTYLRRLWCVWELQCVFTFCLQELAVERVVVVLAGGSLKDASTWSLDRAHTFDPNEEYRLRCLVHAIGEERFVQTVRGLPSCGVSATGASLHARVSSATAAPPSGASTPLPSAAGTGRGGGGAGGGGSGGGGGGGEGAGSVTVGASLDARPAHAPSVSVAVGAPAARVAVNPLCAAPAAATGAPLGVPPLAASEAAGLAANPPLAWQTAAPPSSPPAATAPAAAASLSATGAPLDAMPPSAATSAPNAVVNPLATLVGVFAPALAPPPPSSPPAREASAHDAAGAAVGALPQAVVRVVGNPLAGQPPPPSPPATPAPAAAVSLATTGAPPEAPLIFARAIANPLAAQGGTSAAASLAAAGTPPDAALSPCVAQSPLAGPAPLPAADAPVAASDAAVGASAPATASLAAADALVTANPSDRVIVAGAISACPSDRAIVAGAISEGGDEAGAGAGSGALGAVSVHVAANAGNPFAAANAPSTLSRLPDALPLKPISPRPGGGQAPPRAANPSAAAAASLASVDASQLPPGWVVRTSTSTGKAFLFHPATKMTTWSVEGARQRSAERAGAGAAAALGAPPAEERALEGAPAPPFEPTAASLEQRDATSLAVADSADAALFLTVAEPPGKP